MPEFPAASVFVAVLNVHEELEVELAPVPRVPPEEIDTSPALSCADDVSPSAVYACCPCAPITAGRVPIEIFDVTVTGGNATLCSPGIIHNGSTRKKSTT